MKRLLFAWVGLAGLVMASAAQARVEADPSKDYKVTPDVGPWMICATCYEGELATQLGHEMVLELRSRFDLPAYVMNKGEAERKRQLDEWQRWHQQFPEANVPFRGVRIKDQCAVLIGGYSDMDAARRALERVKKLPKPSSDRLCPFYARVRPVDGPDGDTSGVLEGTYVNPFFKSFVVRNPAVPVDRRDDAKNDPFLKRLNSGESYSLLKCKKPWTLVVALFPGMSTIKPADAKESFWDTIWGTKGPDGLSAGASNAHELAAALQKAGFNERAGYEAYVLHMRAGSLVSIGGFEGPEDPRIRSAQEALATNLRLGQSVLLLPQPFPIEVPRPK